MIVGVDNGSAEDATLYYFQSRWRLLILVENIHVGKSHINEICEDCLKICFCKILFVFKLDMFKNKGLYFWQDSVCF
jgi:hypothetical protein